MYKPIPVLSVSTKAQQTSGSDRQPQLPIVCRLSEHKSDCSLLIVASSSRDGRCEGQTSELSQRLRIAMLPVLLLLIASSRAELGDPVDRSGWVDPNELLLSQAPATTTAAPSTECKGEGIHWRSGIDMDRELCKGEVTLTKTSPPPPEGPFFYWAETPETTPPPCQPPSGILNHCLDHPIGAKVWIPEHPTSERSDLRDRAERFVFISLLCRPRAAAVRSGGVSLATRQTRRQQGSPGGERTQTPRA